MKKVVLISLAVMLAITLVVVGCPAPVDDDDDVKPIKIGAILEFTGALAVYGLPSKAAMEIALEEVNYEVAGRPIQVIWEDNATDPTVALEKARKLIEVDKVDLIVGINMGDQHVAVAPYLSQQDILWLCGFGAEPEQLAMADRWMIAYPGTVYNAAIQIADYAYEQGWRKMATISHDYMAGYGHVAGFADRFEELGGTVVQQQWVPYGTPDYAPYLIALDPDADFLAVAIWIPDLLTLIRQHGEFGITQPMVIDEIDAMSRAHLKALGEHVVGTRGIIRMSSVALDYPKTQEFVESFRAKYGEDPLDSAACGYVPMALALAGLEATGGDPSRIAMFEALQSIELETPFGPVFLSPTGSGLVVSNRWATEVIMENGDYDFKIVETYEAVMDPRDVPGWLDEYR